MNEPPQPTMQQIADRAGVSRMAVSLALRNSPNISPPTIARIRKIAEELGYRPNPLVAALMTQLHRGRAVRNATALAYVTSHSTADGWRRSAPFVEYFEGSHRRAEELGYVLEEWWLHRPGMTGQRLSHILYTRNIHGLLLAPMPAGGAEMHLDWAKFASATIGHSLAGPCIHRASADQYGAITLALRELTSLGCERIGLAITRESDERTNHAWSAGMLVHQAAIAARQRVPLLLTDGAFASSFVPWFTRHRPHVVLSLSEECLPLLEKLGARVPRDVGFAQLALTADAGHLAGVNLNFRLVGAGAIDLLDAQLRYNQRGLPLHQKTVLIPGTWVPGTTVCRPRAK